MRIPKVHLRRRLYSAGMRSRAMTRIRHFRGHGVHSPFVYSLIRNILMKRRRVSSACDLYDQLRRRGVGRHWAVQLQNIFTELRYERFRFVSADDRRPVEDGEMCIVDGNTPCEALFRVVKDVPHEARAIACILSPTLSKERMRRAREAVGLHNGTSIDNRSYMLLFYDERLPKQHFKL